MKKDSQKLIFSIIVPTYNEEKYVGACLKSLRDQDFKGQKEIIVIDGYSTDKTPLIAKQFDVKFYQAKREGPGLAKRKGCLKAMADLIMLTDSDIIYPPHWLSKAYENLKDPKVCATGGPYILQNLPKFLWGINNYLYSWVLKMLKLLPGGSMAFKKKCYRQVGGLPEGVTFGEDTYLSHQLSKIGQVLIDPDLAVSECGRRWNLKGFISGNYSYAKHALKYLRSEDTEELKKIRMKKIP